MNEIYQPDPPADLADVMILAGSGPEPEYDGVMQQFLNEGLLSLEQACEQNGLLDYASLGKTSPWLYRLTFATSGLVRKQDGSIVPNDRHVVALRFLPDYLRNADRFAMLRLIEPTSGIWHPNISDNGPGAGAICVEIYPGETLLEICHSLHDLFRWRLRQYDERDALNPAACGWGREHVHEPLDDRPLFGQKLNLQWGPSSNG